MPPTPRPLPGPVMGPVVGPVVGPVMGTVTRRATLGGAAALTAVAVAGCTDDAPRRTVTPPPTRRAGTDPDVLLAATVLADERAMLERVKATTRRHPTLKADLAGARAAHRAHVRLLARAVPKQTASPSPSASGTPSARPSPGVPAKPGPALAALARAEDRLSHVGRRSAFAARSGAFARVLASMAAAATQQAAQLSAAAQDRA